MPLEIVTVPCLSDNYAYLLRDAATGKVGVVDAPDPGDPVPDGVFPRPNCIRPITRAMINTTAPPMINGIFEPDFFGCSGGGAPQPPGAPPAANPGAW